MRQTVNVNSKVSIGAVSQSRNSVQATINDCLAYLVLPAFTRGDDQGNV